MSTNMQELENDTRRRRQEVLICEVLDRLRRTVEVWPMSPDKFDADRVMVEMTDASAQIIAPLVEAVDILEAMIWASDGCRGHQHCTHSMEPWQRARALLQGKWDA